MNLHGITPKVKDREIHYFSEGTYVGSFWRRLLDPAYNWNDDNLRIALYEHLNISAAPGDTITIDGEERVLT